MAAIQSCGVGPAGLFRPIALLGVVIAALLVWLSFWAIPAGDAHARSRSAPRRCAMRSSALLEPGRFRTFGGGNVVFYAERVDDNGILHNVNVFVDRTRGAGQRGQARDLGRNARRAARRRTGRADVRALRRRALRRRARAAASSASSSSRGRHPDPARRAGRRAPARRSMKPTSELLQLVAIRRTRRAAVAHLHAGPAR